MLAESTEIEIKLSELRTALRALHADPPAKDATEEVRKPSSTPKLADETEGARRPWRRRSGPR